MTVEKIKSGIPGFNALVDGGINKNSVNVVIGAAGTGKTTMVFQFLKRGLEEGKEGIHITLDETSEQLIKEAENLGWDDVRDYVKSEQLIFMEATGSDFLTFIENELPELIGNWEGSTDARIGIDPLTPVLWSVKEEYRQREVISSLFRMTRKIGTVLSTLEEHNTFGTLKGAEAIIPMYLADSVIHLSYMGLGFSLNRMVKIIKCRSSWHSEVAHPYNIIPGVGLAVHQIKEGRKKAFEIPKSVYDHLNKKIEPLPAETRKRIYDAVRHMNNEDIGIFDYNTLVDMLIDEYT